MGGRNRDLWFVGWGIVEGRKKLDLWCVVRRWGIVEGRGKLEKRCVEVGHCWGQGEAGSLMRWGWALLRAGGKLDVWCVEVGQEPKMIGKHWIIYTSFIFPKCLCQLVLQFHDRNKYFRSLHLNSCMSFGISTFRITLYVTGQQHFHDDPFTVKLSLIK